MSHGASRPKPLAGATRVRRADRAAPSRAGTALRACTLAAMACLFGCGVFTDAATRLAFDIESAARTLKAHGDRITLHHRTPSRPGECAGPYTVQLDKVGALVFWCRDEDGKVLSSPGTSHHRRFVKTPETYYLHKGAGEALVVELERRGRDVVIVDVR